MGLLPAEGVELGAPSSRFSLSALLAATSTRRCRRRRSSAASWSAGVSPAAASTTNTMTSASTIASRACSWTLASIGSSGASSSPPVSTTTNRRPFHSASPYSRSRVVRARSSTIAVRAPTTRLNSVLLPTFGRPTMATTGSPAVAATGDLGRAGGGRTADFGQRGRPAGWGCRDGERGVGQLAAAWRCASGVPASSRIRSATAWRSSIGVEVPPVTPTTARPSNTAGVGQVAGALDLDRRRAGDLAQPGQLLGVRAGAAADDDHQVDLARPVHRVLLAPDRDRADGVDDLQLVARAGHERGELLELPRRLRALARSAPSASCAGSPLPVLFLVDHDRVGREAEQADDLGVLGRAEEHDRVALLDELRRAPSAPG